MPLLKGKGKKSVGHNIEELEHCGDRPHKQNIAIAYSLARKKKASGGTVESGDPEMNYADGGKVVEPTPVQAGGGPYSKLEGSDAPACPNCGHKAMSKGGQVANDLEEGVAADELPNEFDDLVLRDGLEFHETGSNSGDKIGGPSKDDLVARAMLKKKAKR